MQGTWNNAQAYYRCTYPTEYACTNHLGHPRTVYLREADILPALDGWLSQVFSPARRTPSTPSPKPRQPGSPPGHAYEPSLPVSRASG
jgi:site-specific DNA recombinase